MEQQVRFCTSADGTRIAYATYGDAAARTLVVAQAFEYAQQYWSKFPGIALFEGLAVGHRLVTFDRRGVGGSQRDVDDVSIRTQVADLAAVVDELGAETFDLMGWGNGGTVVTTYAVEHRERVGRLVLWHPLLPTSEALIRGLQALPKSIRADWSLARRSWAAIGYPNGPVDMQRHFSNMLRDSVAPETAARHFEVIANFDCGAILRDIEAPTLVLTNSGAQKSEVTSVRTVASLIPSARLVTLEGDWGSQLLDRDRLIAAIRGFLDEADADLEAGLHSGTAVIVFADVVESTALTEEMGDTAFREKARKLDSALRSIIRESEGTPVEGKLLGDGVLAVFTSAKNAIEAAMRFGEAGEAVGLGLHLGIHAGDVIREGDNVFGGAVNIAARISGESEAGEVLVSDTVRGLARTSAGVSFEDRGERELNGVGEPMRVWRVRGGVDSGLQAEHVVRG